jgi:hypothetical protein
MARGDGGGGDGGVAGQLEFFDRIFALGERRERYALSELQHAPVGAARRAFRSGDGTFFITSDQPS